MRKCQYCDFVSYPLSGEAPNAVQAYLAGVASELKWYAPLIRARGLASVYVGGGTPTALRTDELRALMALLRETLDPAAGRPEFTVEANPGTVQPEKLRALREGGVNRLSFGVQAFDDALLRRLGRLHSAEQAVEAVEMAREAGFDNISLDLMFALPGQSVSHFASSLETALRLRPEHLSVYSLIVEEGTPFAELRQRGQLSLPDEDTELEMYDLAREVLGGEGYLHYEISNFARPDRQSRHNILYWQNREYVGLGPAAHGFVAGIRYGNATRLDDYAGRLLGTTDQKDWTANELAQGRVVHEVPSRAAASAEEVSEADSRSETMFLGLRMLSGVNRTLFRKRHGVELEDAYGSELGVLESQGLVDLTGDRVCLSAKGLPVANRVFGAFV